MPTYEFMCVVSVSAPSAHLTSLFRRLSTVVSSSGGVVRGIENLGLRPLAFKMRAHLKQNTMGRYIRYRVAVNPTTMREIIVRLNNDEEVIRFLCEKEPLLPPAVAEKRRGKRVRATTPNLTTTMHPLLPSPVAAAEAAAKSSSSSSSASASLDSVRTRTPLDYFVARALLRFGSVSSLEIAAMKRHWPDADWDHRRTQLLTKAGVIGDYLPNNNQNNDTKIKSSDGIDHTAETIKRLTNPPNASSPS